MAWLRSDDRAMIFYIPRRYYSNSAIHSGSDRDMWFGGLAAMHLALTIAGGKKGQLLNGAKSKNSISTRRRSW